MKTETKVAESKKPSFLKKLTQQREFSIFLIVIALFVILSFASPYFLSEANLMSVLLGLSTESIIACGMIMVIITGGIDLSVGSVTALVGAICGYCMKTLELPVIVAILIGLAVGISIGFINGTLISRLGINAFIITLGWQYIARGLVMVVTNGLNISPLPKAFNNLGQGKLFGAIQYPIIVMLILMVCGDILLRKSRFFRQNYYIGNNEKAAALTGINVPKMKTINFMINGGLAAVAGILLTARLGSASSTAGTNLEFKAITAVILGGASLAGGSGTILGAFLGSLLMGLITNGLNLLGVDVYWQTFVIGCTLLLAVILDNFKVMQKAKERRGINKDVVDTGEKKQE
jgi:ribose transport system permease protein